MPFVRSSRHAAAALLLLAAMGCSHPAAFRCERNGGRRWREVRTSHFTLKTDLITRDARVLAEELEATLHGLSRGLLHADPELPARVNVIAFASTAEHDLFMPERALAGVTQSAWGDTVILIPGSLRGAQRFVVAHELAHVLTSGHARQPWWFREGVATYAETIEWSGAEKRLTLGRTPRHRIEHVFEHPHAVRDLLTRGSELDVYHYSTAWALVHFLMSRHSAEWEDLQTRFARGEDPAEAWAAVFPQWAPSLPDGPELLEAEIWRYLEAGTFMYVYPDARPDRVDILAERVLPPAEVHDLRLGLRWINRGTPVPTKRVFAEIDEALSEDPGNVSALARLAGLRPARAPVLARRATELHPDDWRAWRLLADAARKEDPALQESALRRAIELEPDSAPALNGLASLLLESGSEEGALELATRAARIAPRNPSILDTLAAALEKHGRCREALAVQRRVVDLLPERLGTTDEALATRFSERRDRLEGACGKGAPEGGAP